MVRHLGFEMGEVFPAGDELAEWIATVSIALNDFSFASGQVTSQEQAGEWIYSLRVALSHFTEAGKYLESTACLPAVASFLESLARGSAEYEVVLDTYRRNKSQLHAIRDVAAFHYPAWRESPRRPMKRALEATADSVGLVRLNDPVHANRLLFADEVISAIVTLACGGREEMDRVLTEVAEATAAFAVFGDAAIDRYLVDRCGIPKEYELLDADDHAKGWREVSS